MKRSGFARPSHEEAVKQAQEWQERQRARASEKARETGVKWQKQSPKPKSEAAKAGKRRSKAKRAEKDALEAEFKQVCRVRDEFRCRWVDKHGERCPNRDEHIPVHHKNERSQRPDERYNPDNGACICWVHHDFMHHTVEGRARGRELGLLGGETYELAMKKNG